MNNKRIAFFIPTLEYGGAERVILTLVNGIVERGYDVELVLANAIGPYLTEVDPQVKIINLSSSRSLFSIFGLIRYLKSSKPYVMVSALDNANLISVLAKFISNVNTKVIITQHSTLSSEKLVDRSFKGKIVRLLMRRLYPKANLIIGVSDGVSRDLKEQLGLELNLDTVYNPVVGDRINHLQYEPVLCKWFDEGEPPVILSAGRLTEAKDFELLIKSFALIRKSRICRLVIVGDGPLNSKLIQLACELGVQEDLLLTGFQTNPFNWMKQASVFVVSSKFEGLSNVLIEAMACGQKVVSTDCPNGPFEILEGGKWGRLVPVGDEVGLALAIESTLDSNSDFDIRERANFFSVDKSINRYLELIHS
jgi:glycosyltransferase involved in cell wall biosynthesis